MRGRRAKDPSKRCWSMGKLIKHIPAGGVGEELWKEWPFCTRKRPLIDCQSGLCGPSFRCVNCAETACSSDIIFRLLCRWRWMTQTNWSLFSPVFKGTLPFFFIFGIVKWSGKILNIPQNRWWSEQSAQTANEAKQQTPPTAMCFHN